MNYATIRVGDELTYTESGTSFVVRIIENNSTDKRWDFKVRIVRAEKGIRIGAEFDAMFVKGAGIGELWSMEPIKGAKS